MNTEMSFLDHLEELRWHLIRGLAVVFIFTIIAFLSKNILFNHILLAPSRTDFFTYELFCKLGQWLNSDVVCIKKLPFIIQSRKLTGQFAMHISASIVAGLICGFPYLFWEIWRFVSPALYKTEQEITRGVTFFVSILFSIGIAFGYFMVTPVSINFLSNYQIDPSIVNEFDIVSYISTVCMLTLSCGIMFQLPMVVYFLAKADLITPDIMKKYNKHAFVVILFISAIITPPDVFSQILIGIPIYFLYLGSIFIVTKIQKENAL